ncbi:MAG TPA: hypothetical protein VN668_08645 [Stellaceae bacterium]|nr:hypothetical protein [Stellaceae bacterium]
MLSRADLFALGNPPPPRLLPPSFPLSGNRSSALDVALRALNRLCRQDEDADGDYDAEASLTDQWAAAKARRAALAPTVDDAMAAQDALAEVGLEISLRTVDGKRYLVVLLRRPMAQRINFEQEPAE